MVILFKYLFIIPFSLLPNWLLYFVSNCLSILLYNIIGYRKKVVLDNLKKSFPKKSDKELKSITRKFYKHLSDLVIESVKGFTISQKELLNRYQFTNPELLDKYFEENTSVILVSGHYNNWEFLVQSLNLQFKHQGTGVGKPISSKGFGAMMDKQRKRFGMVIWSNKNVREEIVKYLNNKNPFTLMLLADQSPGDPKKSYWMNFLNQDTPTLYGPEYFAVKYDMPIFYYDVIKVKRGHYRCTLFPVSDDPKSENYGDITFKHNKLLEKTIIDQPEYWLWSHKRWKHSSKAPKEIRK